MEHGGTRRISMLLLGVLVCLSIVATFERVTGASAEFMFTFDDIPEGAIGDKYQHVTFSPGYYTWDSHESVAFPPHSGNQVAYSWEIDNRITFDSPVYNVSLYISVQLPLLFVVAFLDRFDGVLYQEIVPQDSKNYPITFSSPGGSLATVQVQGNGSFYQNWVIDDLAANIEPIVQVPLIGIEPMAAPVIVAICYIVIGLARKKGRGIRIE
ncbi:MAG: hypothetical protein JW839_17730 [Candidatus Lokiarchaeota archaeon]|nr:hypothetical protein [Candidatus Lokiarchaeota archaeon]